MLSILVSFTQGEIQVLTPHSYPHHYFTSQFTVLSFTSMHISHISPAEYTTVSQGKENIKEKKKPQTTEAITSYTSQVIIIAALLSSCFSLSYLSSWVERAHLAIKPEVFVH